MSDSGFSALDLRKVEGARGGRQLFKLLAPLDFSASINGGGLLVTVPKGFVTDFASVPKVLWPIFPPAGPWCEAAVMHDYLYSLPQCSRFLADALFREAMARLDVPLWRRLVAFYLVRLLGRRHKKSRIV